MALSLLNTNEVQVARMVKALYNAAPGYTFMTNFSSYVTAKGMNGLAEGLVADFAANDNATLAAAVATNLGLTGTALTAGTAYLQGQFESMGAAKRGQVILDAVNGLSTLTADATYGAAATAFNDSVATSVTYSSNSSNNSTVLATLQAAAVPTGDTTALITGTDNLTGTARTDTFTGTFNSTFTSIDKINGGAGNDILKATLSTDTTTVQPVALTDVETVRVTGVGSSAANTLSVKFATGLTLLEFNDVTTSGGSDRVYTITDITSPSIPLAVKTVTNANSIVNFTHAAAGLTGAADTVALTLEDVGTSLVKVGAVQVDTAGIEALTIASNGAGNYISSLATGGDVKSITITGAAPLTITTLTGSDASLTAIDASAATGKISIDAATATSVLKITGGSANDTFTFAATLDVNDTVDGGAGTDTVSVSSAIATNVVLTNIETLSLTAGADQDLSQANLAGITTVSSNPAAGQTTALTSATPGKHTLSYTGTTSTGATTYALKSTLNTTADSLTVNVGSGSSNGADRGDFTANDIETLTITSSSLTATTANKIGLEATSASKVIISGTALTFDAINTASEVIIDASAMTGILTVISEASTDQTIIGGAGNDAITFTASHLDSNDSVNGGGGNDTVTIATTAAATTSAFGRVAMTGVENLAMTIDIDDAATTALVHSIDLRNAPLTTLSITTGAVTADSTATNGFTISNIQSGLTKVTLNAAVASTGGTYTLDSDRLTSTDIVFTAGAVSVTGLTLALTGDWTGVNLKQTDSSASATETFSSITAPTSLTSLSIDSSEHATTITSLTATKLASLTITGDNTTTLTSLSQSTAALANVDGSAASGAINLTATTRTAAATVTTGSGDDSIELTLTTEGGNTINAGTNATLTASTGDTLVLNGTATGATIVDLSATADQITQINTVANAATQIAFEHVNASGATVAGGTFSITGTSGINVITGATGNDTIDGGSGNDVISGGNGSDTIILGSGSTESDTVYLDSPLAAGYGNDLITGFTAGAVASGGDVLRLKSLDGVADVVEIDVRALAAGPEIGTAKAAADWVMILNGTSYATSALAEAASNILGATTTAATANGDVYLIWSDGTNAYVTYDSDYDSDSTALITVATLVGVTHTALSGLVAANLIGLA